MKGRRKINLFQGWVPVERGEHMERRNESVYGDEFYIHI
jgi:hypothetical protein